MDERVLVTGVTGLLSTHISKRLQDGNYNVSQVGLKDNLWQNYDFSEFNAIVHVVGVTPANVKNDDDYYTINTQLTTDLAIKAKNEGVELFVYISSMAVYGASQSIDYKEGVVTNLTTCSPKDDYGKSKLQAEIQLQALEDDNFKVCIIRVPSIYGYSKIEYMDQYKYLAEKLPFIPIVFPKNYKSVISVDNLSELVYLIVNRKHSGIICPDDGEYSAVDFCSAIYPKKKKSRFVGKLMEIFLRKNARIIDYYGAICYSKDLTNVFDGEYRVKSMSEAVYSLYE